MRRNGKTRVDGSDRNGELLRKVRKSGESFDRY
jgi:hypothetical protein